MRRAYPQFLTAGGQELPAEILQVIFPLTYWDSIRKHVGAARSRSLRDRRADRAGVDVRCRVRSSANAWGLMQIVPATGRQLARVARHPRFTTAMLTNPETNIRLGTLYFSQLVEQFGGTYYALASYNAGESRVVRWKSERPGLDEDEFIDDIPFPETQNYVKRILGTAEDYRRLYAGRRPRSRGHHLAVEAPQPRRDRRPRRRRRPPRRRRRRRRAPAKKKPPRDRKRRPRSERTASRQRSTVYGNRQISYSDIVASLPSSRR